MFFWFILPFLQVKIISKLHSWLFYCNVATFFQRHVQPCLASLASFTAVFYFCHAALSHAWLTGTRAPKLSFLKRFIAMRSNCFSTVAAAHHTKPIIRWRSIKCKTTSSDWELGARIIHEKINSPRLGHKRRSSGAASGAREDQAAQRQVQDKMKWFRKS